MTDEWEDEAALEEHLEAVKPEPVDEEALDELVEPSADVGTAQEEEEQAAMDDAAGGGSDEAAGATGPASEGLDELVEPVTEFRTVQEREAADSGGDGDE